MASSCLSRLFSSPRRHPTVRPLPSCSAAAPDPSPRQTRAPIPARSPNGGLGAMVNSLFKEPDLDRLVARFKEASSSHHFRRRHRIHEVAVQRLAHAGRLNDVADILEEQKKYPDDIAREGFAAHLIVLYGRAGLAPAAEETFRQLPSLGCRRTAMSFNALLSACSYAGDFGRMDAIFQSVPAEDPGIVPDLVSYNVVISSLCKRKDLGAAMCLLEMMEMRGLEPNLITFTTLLNGYYANGQFIEAEKVWEKMAEKNCVPDVKCFNAKLRGLVLEGRTSEAVELVGKLPSMGLKPDTFSFNALIRGHCKDGNLDDAKKVFENLIQNDCRPNRETFEVLVPSLCQRGQFDLALRMCKESVSRKCNLAAPVLQGVADGLFKNSRVEDATKLVKLAWLNSYDRKSIWNPSPSSMLEL